MVSVRTEDTGSKSTRARGLTRVMLSVRPMTAWKRSCAAGPDTTKNSQMNRYSRQELSRRA